MILRLLLGFGLALSGLLATLAADPVPLQPSPSALPAVSAPVVVAQDASCASACQAEHDQCRVATKGSPSCDAARQRCLQTCIANKKK
jgi:hypothetical protein